MDTIFMNSWNYEWILHRQFIDLKKHGEKTDNPSVRKKFFTIEEAKETVLDFLHGTVQAF